jgi:hypothetical protein
MAYGFDSHLRYRASEVLVAAYPTLNRCDRFKFFRGHYGLVAKSGLRRPSHKRLNRWFKSSPVHSSAMILTNDAGVTQLGSAMAFQAASCEFKSRLPP